VRDRVQVQKPAEKHFEQLQDAVRGAARAHAKCHARFVRAATINGETKLREDGFLQGGRWAGSGGGRQGRRHAD